jgi:ABC-type sugar transport system permease subunit
MQGVVRFQKTKHKFDIKRTAFILSFIIIPAAQFVVFYVFVNFNSFLMAFQREVNGATVWGFENFGMFFREFGLETSDIRLSFVNTFKTFGIACAMFLVNIFVSFFLYKKIRFYKLFRILFFLPGVISGVIVSSIFIRMTGNNGFIAPLVGKLFGLDYTPSLLGETRFANMTVFVNYIWLLFPANMIIWGGTFSRIPDSVLESARLDGANWLVEAFRIVIPMVWPTFAIQFMLLFGGIFGASGNVFLLTQGKWGTQTLGNWMYMQVYSFKGGSENGLNYMSSIGMLLTAVTFVIALSVRKITGRMFNDVEY